MSVPESMKHHGGDHDDLDGHRRQGEDERAVGLAVVVSERFGVAHDGEGGDEHRREEPEEAGGRPPVEGQPVEQRPAEEQDDDRREKGQREGSLSGERPQGEAHPNPTVQGFLKRILPKRDSARDPVFWELMERVMAPAGSPGFSP